MMIANIIFIWFLIGITPIATDIWSDLVKQGDVKNQKHIQKDAEKYDNLD